MRYGRFDQEHDDWLRRVARVMRSREGFAWGAFLLGFVCGGLIF